MRKLAAHDTKGLVEKLPFVSMELSKSNARATFLGENELPLIGFLFKSNFSRLPDKLSLQRLVPLALGKISLGWTTAKPARGRLGNQENQ